MRSRLIKSIGPYQIRHVDGVGFLAFDDLRIVMSSPSLVRLEGAIRTKTDCGKIASPLALPDEPCFYCATRHGRGPCQYIMR